MHKDDTIIKAHLCGVDVKHEAGFTIDRPSDPYGSCLFLCFRSAAMIQTEAGLEKATAGDCIIHTPEFPQYHSSIEGDTEGYRNDWLHVSPSAVRPLMANLKLPFNRLIALGESDVMSPFIEMMKKELRSIDIFTAGILRNLLEGLLLAVKKKSSIMLDNATVMTPREREYYPAFAELREKMLDACSVDINVAELAGRLNLSPERFAVLYSKFFKASPYSELIDARILKAQELLMSTSKAVSDIGADCGWDNFYYFSRIFKNKTGLSPSAYRHGGQISF